MHAYLYSQLHLLLMEQHSSPHAASVAVANEYECAALSPLREDIRAFMYVCMCVFMSAIVSLIGQIARQGGCCYDRCLAIAGPAALVVLQNLLSSSCWLVYCCS